MRVNIWIVLAFLLVLFAITRFAHYQGDTRRICADDPSASCASGEKQREMQQGAIHGKNQV